MEFEITIEQLIRNNVLLEIFQNKESGLYGLNVKLDKLNLKFPAKFESLESLKQMIAS